MNEFKNGFYDLEKRDTIWRALHLSVFQCVLLELQKYISFRFCVFCDWSERMIFIYFSAKMVLNACFRQSIFYIAFAWQYLNRFCFQIQKKGYWQKLKRNIRSLSQNHILDLVPVECFRQDIHQSFVPQKRWRSPQNLCQSYCWRREFCGNLAQ